ncbi:hypothetical protein [Sphaerotilus natans]|nr:hypothetical protein [Sphaerotilus natans]
MENPELLLEPLNRALRDLRAAAAILQNDRDRIDAALLPVMRRLMLAEVVGNQWLLAVGGSQGAGKTTLVRALYDLQGEDARWLAPNEGRGEQLPILVQEDSSCTRPQGLLRQLCPSEDGSHMVLRDVPATDAQQFCRAARGEMPEVMLPVLKVPRRHFQSDRQALILLPGYEAIQRDNRDWQESMRLTLMGASGCILVTDQTRLANQQQQEIQRDLLPPELQACRPWVMVSKTEGLARDPERRDALRLSAARVFFPEEPVETAMQRVLCVGADDPTYRDEWLPAASAMLRDTSAGSGAQRRMQLARLGETIDRDLGRAINLVHSRAALHQQSLAGHGGGSAAQVMDDCLGLFDDAAAELRELYQQSVQDMLEQHGERARHRLDEILVKRHEGLLNKLVRVCDTVSDQHIRLRETLTAAWQAPGDVLPQYVDRISSLTARVLSGPRPVTAALPETATALHRLGYLDADDQPVPSRLTDPQTRRNLRALLAAPGDAPPDRSSEALERTVRLLPAMALEYTRIAAALPALAGVHAETLTPLEDMGRHEAGAPLREQFQQFSEVAVPLLQGLAVMLAIDFSADGRIDTVGSLLSLLGLGDPADPADSTTSSASTLADTAAELSSTVTPVASAAAGGSMAAAITGVIAIGFLINAALTEVRRRDQAMRELSQAMLRSILDRHLVHFMVHFDQLMQALRRHLQQSLRRRYRLDERLMEHDRLACALADASRFQRDMLDALGRSGRDLDPFGLPPNPHRQA